MQDYVQVPALVGLEVAEAFELAFAARVVAVAADPDEPLPVTGIVTAQRPPPGTSVAPADQVLIAVDPNPGGGGGGGGAPVEPPLTPLDPVGTKPGP